TPLICAARSGDTTAIQLLTQSMTTISTFDREYYINQKDIQCKTALDWAAYHGNEAAIDALLGAGADATPTDRKGKTCLHWAAYNGHTTAVKKLLTHKVFDTPDRMGRTALHWAATHGYSDIAHALLEAMPSEQKIYYLNHRDAEGQTALFLAARYEHPEVIALLRLYGAPDIPNTRGETAVTATAKKNKKTALATLMETGIQDVPDYAGRTAVSHVAENGLLGALQTLLANGAHDIPDYTGKTGLTWALEHHQFGCVKALSEYWQKNTPKLLQLAEIDRDALQQAEQEFEATVKKRHIQDTQPSLQEEKNDLQ
ncbi:hypothetical protein CVU75_02605, partial [Candidatus Dependentiae bacterium HGW-Dependentiae-1]